MYPIHIRNFAQNKEPNTFIGGIAKTGGTGVNAPINTPSLLATKLGIANNRISVFKVIGNNVSCRIKGNYEIQNYGFMDNTNITYYRDEDDILKKLNRATFLNTNINEVKLNGVNDVRTDTFRNTKLVTISLPSLINNTNNTVNFERTIYCENTLLEYVYMPNFTGGYLDWFISTPKLVEVVSKVSSFIYGPPFYNSGIPNFYSNTLLTWRSNLAFGLSKTVTIDVPSLTEITYGTSIISQTYTKYFYAINCVKILQPDNNGFNGAFSRQNEGGSFAIEIIDIRKCKELGHAIFQYGLKTSGGNTTIKIHEFLKTSNGGLPDVNLTYAKDIRGATVEFYDDAGIYVSTL